MPGDGNDAERTGTASGSKHGFGRGAAGRFVPGDAAREAGRRGGKRRAGKISFTRSLGLKPIDPSSPFAPYRRLAERFRVTHIRDLERQFGGELGAGPRVLCASAALDFAASRWAADEGFRLEDPKMLLLASQLATTSRLNLTAAREFARREAMVRRPPDFFHRLRATSATKGK